MPLSRQRILKNKNQCKDNQARAGRLVDIGIWSRSYNNNREDVNDVNIEFQILTHVSSTNDDRVAAKLSNNGVQVNIPN